MEDKKAHKIIFRLTNAVIVLSIMVVGLVITILVLYAFERIPYHEEPMAVCGGGIYPDDYVQPEDRPLVFKENCSSCHFIERDMTGPRISGAIERGPYEGWFRDFITNQDSLLQAGDEYTLRLKEHWGNMGWNHQYDDLPETDLEALERLAD